MTGRWASRDLIEERGGLNLYGFVRNSPVGSSDYLGNIPWRDGQEWHCCLESMTVTYLRFLGGRGSRGRHQFKVDVQYEAKGVKKDKDGTEICCDPALCQFTQWIRGQFSSKDRPDLNGGFPNRQGMLINPIVWQDDGYHNDNAWDDARPDIERIQYTDSPGHDDWFNGAYQHFSVWMDFKMEVVDSPTGVILASQEVGLDIWGGPLGNGFFTHGNHQGF